MDCCTKRSILEGSLKATTFWGSCVKDNPEGWVPLTQVVVVVLVHFWSTSGYFGPKCFWIVQSQSQWLKKINLEKVGQKNGPTGYFVLFCIKQPLKLDQIVSNSNLSSGWVHFLDTIYFSSVQTDITVYHEFGDLSVKEIESNTKNTSIKWPLKQLGQNEPLIKPRALHGGFDPAHWVKILIQLGKPYWWFKATNEWVTKLSVHCSCCCKNNNNTDFMSNIFT